MPRGLEPRRLPLWFRILVITIGAGFAVALLVSVWRIVVPPERGDAISRLVRPGRRSDLPARANARADEAFRSLAAFASDADTLMTESGRVVSLTVHAEIPLEEANRILSGALIASGLEVLDAFERASGTMRRELNLTYGLDGQPCGVVRILASRKAPEPPDGGPAVALVLDDLGYQSAAELEPFLKLEFPITAAVLPGYPRSAAIAERAAQLGRDVILHLPMEPEGYPQKDPGPGAILVHLSREEIRRRLAHNLESVPGAIGVSSHMGSMATQDRPTMEEVLTVLKERRLFFLDSRTSHASLAGKIAQALKVACVDNDLFLDADPSPAAIRERFAELVGKARRDGSAIGIFHPFDACLEVVPVAVARYRREGVRFVALRDIDASRWTGGLPASRGRAVLHVAGAG
jgi:polysaccharide deacetylase 2 family uncharacterized protein YibQ